MLALHPDFEGFLDTYEGLLRERFGPEVTSDFLGGTAQRFLGFDDPTNHNTRRLRERYERFAPNRLPDWLASETPIP
jgi:hypothetical protein